MESIKKASAQQHDFLDFKSVLNASLNAAGELVSRPDITKMSGSGNPEFYRFYAFKDQSTGRCMKFFLLIC